MSTKHVDADNSALITKIETNLRTTKLVIESELLSTKILLAKVTLKID